MPGDNTLGYQKNYWYPGGGNTGDDGAWHYATRISDEIEQSTLDRQRAVDHQNEIAADYQKRANDGLLDPLKTQFQQGMGYAQGAATSQAAAGGANPLGARAAMQGAGEMRQRGANEMASAFAEQKRNAAIYGMSNAQMQSDAHNKWSTMREAERYRQDMNDERKALLQDKNNQRRDAQAAQTAGAVATTVGTGLIAASDERAKNIKDPVRRRAAMDAYNRAKRSSGRVSNKSEYAARVSYSPDSMPGPGRRDEEETAQMSHKKKQVSTYDSGTNAARKAAGWQPLPYAKRKDEVESDVRIQPTPKDKPASKKRITPTAKSQPKSPTKAGKPTRKNIKPTLRKATKTTGGREAYTGVYGGTDDPGKIDNYSNQWLDGDRERAMWNAERYRAMEQRSSPWRERALSAVNENDAWASQKWREADDASRAATQGMRSIRDPRHIYTRGDRWIEMANRGGLAVSDERAKSIKDPVQRQAAMDAYNRAQADMSLLDSTEAPQGMPSNGPANMDPYQPQYEDLTQQALMESAPSTPTPFDMQMGDQGQLGDGSVQGGMGSDVQTPVPFDDSMGETQFSDSQYDDLATTTPMIQYEYKPEIRRRFNLPSGEQTGTSAQGVERGGPVGQNVVDTDEGGMKVIKLDQGVGAAMGMAASANRRAQLADRKLAELEAKQNELDQYLMNRS